MDHKQISIGVFGNQAKIVDKQTEIVRTLSFVAVKGHIHPDLVACFESLPAIPEVLIVNLSDQAIRELNYLEKEITNNKAILVIGDKTDARVLSCAISAGVTEFVDRNYIDEDFLKAIRKIILNRTATIRTTMKRKMTAVINAKGGSGASFIASNIAYVLSEFKDFDVALLDMDLQFGGIALNFDVVPKYSIVEALNLIHEMDPLALEAYMVRYRERLHLLLPSPDEITVPGEIKPAAINSLLHLIERRYNQIVIDLPRIIDLLATEILEHVDNVVIVVQQTLAQFKDGRRMIQILTNDLDIPLNKINIVINRYDPGSNLKKADMIKSVGQQEQVFTIANDFRKVANASNLGEPLCKAAPKSGIAKDLRNLAIMLGDAQLIKRRTGLFGWLRTLSA